MPVRFFVRLSLLLMLLALAACRQDAPPPATATTPAGTAPTLSTTVAATSAAPPTVTLPPAPTAGAPPTLTPLPSPTVPPTPEALFLSGPDAFGSDRNPLTGELVADPALLQRRPIAIKISNSPAQWVRPQSGLNEADIVYEHITEGLITRFTAIFYDTTPADVGPIRSARLIDLEIPAMYDAALAFSGASVGVNQRLNQSDFRARILYSNEDGYYRTGAAKPYEHTLYGNPALFWSDLTANGQNQPPTFTSFMTFSDQPPAGGSPALSATIDYRWELMEWRYNAESGRYYRWSGGVPHFDANTNEQLNVANVVLVFANHVDDATICEQVTNGVCVALSVQAQIWGEGRVVILRDGQAYEGTWQRINRSDMLTFYDASGAPIPLQIGNSWFQMVPTSFTNPVAISGQ